MRLNNKVWLASNSPRRREMLSWADWDLVKISPEVDESRKTGEPPGTYVNRIARLKSSEVLHTIELENGFVLAADTIVVMDDVIFGKPKDERQAFEMLRLLRGQTHQVMTAFAVRQTNSSEALMDICKSAIRMREYSDDEIERYIKSGDPLDKAGAYAIQNRAFDPVENFNGCMASVMGMPLCHLERALRRIDGYHWTEWPTICQMKLEYDCPITRRVMAGEVIG